MFETLVSRLTSPTASRRRHSYHQSSVGAREVQSDPETEEPVGRGNGGARPLLERRRRQRRAATGAATTDSPRGMAALRAFLPLRPSKSLGRLDGIKEIERLAQYERLAGSSEASARRRGQKLSDLERVQDLFPNDFLALHEQDVVSATAGTLKSKTLLRKRPSLDVAMGAAQSFQGEDPKAFNRKFIMEAPCSMVPAPTAPHQSTTLSTTPSSSPSTPAQDRHLFLFTDVMIVAKPRGNGYFKFKEAARVSEIWIAPGSTDTNFLLGWAGSTAPTTYILTYPTQAARDSWFRKIQSAANIQLALEPKTTNIQILYKENSTGIEFNKIMAVAPEMTTSMVIRQALQLVQGGINTEGNNSWGPARDFCLWARTSRDSTPLPLIGCERPHAIQMSRIRQTLSDDEGFDLEHVNSKNNPCGITFELRKINRNVVKTRTPLKLFKRSSGRLFGISLVRLCPNGTLPSAVLTMLRVVHRRGPHTQGIFRKSANAKALKHLREKVDNAGAAGARCPELDNAAVLLVASLLKDFLRSLPQPLMYDSLYADWINILSLNSAEKIPAMRSLLLKLPKAHYCLLSHFVALLHAIARKSSINLMCPMNLAVCVGPSLLWPSSTPCDTAPKAIPALIELLIINAEALFGPHLHTIFGKGSPEPSGSLSLDSGAEESDSLHSVGLSLDSLDLTCTRKEKLSLSRDSGLTLSEDDSNSNGGNSPAPRNNQTNQILPQAGIQTHQAQRVYAKCYTTDIPTQNGIPNSSIGNYDIIRKKHIYVKNTDADLYSREYNHENIYGTNADIQKTIESQKQIYDSIIAQNRYNTNFHDAQPIYGTSADNNVRSSHKIENCIQSNSLVNNSSPSKYLTGFEPEKPPRLGINRANRNAKVYSMHIETPNKQQVPVNRTFCRAKSSDDLLEKRNDRNIYNTSGSQENIYLNVIQDDKSHQSKMKSQKINNGFESYKLDSPQSYSRVYGGWEQRISNYTNANNRQNICGYSDETLKYLKQPTNAKENIYDRSQPSHSIAQNVHLKQSTDKPPTSTIFTRKDWSRQASRTKSLDVVGDSPYSTSAYPDDDTYGVNYVDYYDYNDANKTYKCDIRSVNPAHICSKRCLKVVNVKSNTEIASPPQRQLNNYGNPHYFKNINTKTNCSPDVKKVTIPTKINPRKAGLKYDKNNYSGKLVHSKSLANIHSNSANGDSLYQNTSYNKQTSSNNYSSDYLDNSYNASPKKNDLDVFCESIYGKMGSREGIYSEDIYTAKPTSVSTFDTDSNAELDDSYDKMNYQRDAVSRNPALAPPVPPRKGSHNSPLKNLPPVHLGGDDRKSRSKTNQDQAPDKNMNSKDDKISAGVRSPISSYHIENSDKFMLALEDSGTDTESESYV